MYFKRYSRVDTFPYLAAGAHTAEKQDDRDSNYDAKSNHCQYQPNPDVWSTVTYPKDSSLRVTVGHILHAVDVQNANLSPD